MDASHDTVRLWLEVGEGIPGAAGWEAHPIQSGWTRGPATILRAGEPAQWVIVGPPTVRINGAALGVGVRVLDHRDEIRIDGVRTFFSTERQPGVAPAPLTDPAAVCPRCTRPIPAETPAVRCPQCGVLHHESGTRGCWRYAATCTMCDQPTALDAVPRFTPEVL